MRLAVALALLLATTVSAQQPPIPELALWESKMVEDGATSCAYWAPGNPYTWDQKVACYQYDAGKAFYDNYAYTTDADWLTCGDDAVVFFRDEYVVPNSGFVTGYGTNFSTGMRMHYERTADTDSRDAVFLMSANGAYCGDEDALSDTASYYRQRETALCVNTMIDAEAMGETHRNKLSQPGDDNDMVDQLIDHLDQVYVSKTARCTTGTGCAVEYTNCEDKYLVEPFMAGINMTSLIKEYNRSGDSRILPAVQAAADQLWIDAWIPAEKAMWRKSCKDDPDDEWPAEDIVGNLSVPAPDLNGHLTSVYAWLYQRTGNTGYRDKSDALFEGGALQAFTEGCKQYNQTYAHDRTYIEIRQAEPTTPLRTMSIVAGDTFARFKIGSDAGIPFESDCVVTVETAGETPVEEITSTEGLSVRTLHTTETLSASTAYVATQDCDGMGSDTTEYEFTTSPVASGSNVAVAINIGEATTYSGGSIAKAVVQYDDTTALSLTATNATCPGACTVTLTIPPGRWFYRVLRQTAGSATVVAGGINSLFVPSP